MPMKNFLISAVMLLTSGIGVSANEDVEYVVTKPNENMANFALSVVSDVKSSKQLVPFWHKKASALCSSEQYESSPLIKKNKHCGDAIKSDGTCEILPASVFGVLRCSGI